VALGISEAVEEERQLYLKYLLRVHLMLSISENVLTSKQARLSSYGRHSSNAKRKLSSP